MSEVKNLRVGVVQMQQTQGDAETNIAHLRTLLAEQMASDDDMDLLLLPEMWTTGFMTRAGALTADDLRYAYDRGVEEMQSIADRYDCAVYGSLIETVESERLSNTGLFVTPGGDPHTIYRKRHLFGPGGERKYFVSGDERVQVEWRGWNIRLTICYDLRFPVWQRQYPDGEERYDLLLNCANWPDLRIDAWEILLRARAVENQCYVLASNRTGDGPKGLCYPGYSLILDAKGAELEEGRDGRECILRAELEREALDEFREKFPVLEEIDGYTVRCN